MEPIGLVTPASDIQWLSASYYIIIISMRSEWPQEDCDFKNLLLIGNIWGRFSIKMLSYQYRKPHYRDKTVMGSSYLHNGISYIGKMASLYWHSSLKFDKIPIKYHSIGSY